VDDELPNDRDERVPVCVAVAEAHTLLGNWGKLRTVLKVQSGKWGDLEFQREALNARVDREDGNEPGSKKALGSRSDIGARKPGALTALARFATAWKWDDQYADLLWHVADGRMKPQRRRPCSSFCEYSPRKNTLESSMCFSKC